MTAAQSADAATGLAPSATSARRQGTRDRLLDAATEVFAEEGLQGPPVEAICARAGFTRGAFYSNFSSKEELFLTLLEREFARRSADLQEKVGAVEPELRARQTGISAAEVAGYIAEFFTPTSDAVAWYILETEFQLLTMRDPTFAPEHHRLVERFYASISDVVADVITAAGRRFTLSIDRVMPVLTGVFERALQAKALSKAPAAAAETAAETAAKSAESTDAFGDDMAQRMAQLLFALTEPIEKPARPIR